MSNNNKKLEKLVVKNALRQVEINLLQIDYSYQRPVIQKAVNKIARNYDPIAFGIPLVGERSDGTLWVVDGQQRITYLKSDPKYKVVRVEVFASKGPEHEAEVFRLVNKNRTPLKPVEMFYAMITAGDEDCWAIKGIIEKYGFKIPKSGNRGNGKESAEFRSTNFTCVSALVRIYKYDKNSLSFVLEVLSKVWPDDPNRLSETIVGGLYQFWSNREKIVDMERLVTRLMTTQPTKIMYSAQLGVGNRWGTIADVIEKLYSKRLVKKD